MTEQTATRTDDIKAMWDMLSEFTFAMMITHDEIDGVRLMRGRPMAAYLDPEAGMVRFLSERTDDKVDEVHAEHDVCLSFAQPDKNRFASVSGRATMTTDRALIKTLWGPAADTWFEGDAETADVVVIEVRPIEAEYWRKDETVFTRAFQYAKGLVTDDSPNIGENRKIDVDGNAGVAA